MHAVIFGGSRGVGYFTALYLLALPEWTVSLLLRTPSKIEQDSRLAPFIQQGRLRLVKGDALDKEAVSLLFSQAKVDLVVSSMGKSWPTVRGSADETGSLEAKVTMSGFKFKGTQDPCTGPIRVLLPILKQLPYAPPRVIVCSTMGLYGTHPVMPLLHRVSLAISRLTQLMADILPLGSQWSA